MRLAPDEFTGRRFGKYEVLCRLAVGGMAEIFLGFARSGPFQNRAVVLKNILPEQREDPVALQMLLDEARVTATLSHANIAQVVDLERAGDDVLMVIEFIEGANLEEVVEAWSRQGEPVPLGYALAAVREAAQGLGHAHLSRDAKGAPQPIIHRDVTPRNIMTGFDGATKMLDFGIARAMGAQRRTVAGMVRGTTAYMSPEQAVGKELDPRSDLFSLGIIFHELLTGQRLFFRGNPGAEMAAVYEAEIPPPSKVNRRVPRQLDGVVMRLLERNRERRYQSAMEFIRDLSLAAGSTAWAQDRCADMIRERFADRRRDLDTLLARLPRERGTDSHQALGVPTEGRTIMVQRPRPPMDPEDGRVKTLIESGPEVEQIRARARQVMEERRASERTAEPPTGEIPGLADARTGSERASHGPVPIEPRAPRQATPNPLPARPSTPPPQPARPSTPLPQPGLSAESLFGDLDDAAERTRVLSPGPKPSMQHLQQVPTDPSRSAIAARRPPSSRAPVVVAAVLALFLGAGGGIFIYSRTQGRPVLSLGGLSLTSDRPVSVFLSGQPLGQTPLSSWLPAGDHELELKEADGTVRVLAVTVVSGQVLEKDVALDSLGQKR